MRSRAGFVARHPRPALSEAEVRRAWAGLLEAAGAMSSLVLDGGAVERIAGAAFAGQVLRLRGAFPQRHVTAQAAAEAFLILARAWTAAGFTPAIAGFVGEGARVLGAMLDDATRAAFDRSCRVVGGD